MKKNTKYLVLGLSLLTLTTGCTTYLKDKDGRVDNVHLEAAYAGTDLTSINELVRRLKEKYPNQEIICQPLSLSVSCHIGPGAIAVAISKAIPDSWVK